MKTSSLEKRNRDRKVVRAKIGREFHVRSWSHQSMNEIDRQALRRTLSQHTLRRWNSLFCTLTPLIILTLCCGFSGCGTRTPVPPTAGASSGTRPSPSAIGRGFPVAAPWVSCYGSAIGLGGLDKAASTFRILNIDADPGVGNFTPAQITRLKAGGKNRVISYLNLGAMESFRTYWSVAPVGFLSGRGNTAAHLGFYSGYPDETWMDLSNPDYQHLIVDYVAQRLVAQGVDGFFLDNLELVEHSPTDANGPCSPACRQGGLDLVRRLREKYPSLLIVMQNATGDVTRLGTTGGIAFPDLLDGVSHEEVYTPRRDAMTEKELQSWRDMHLMPGGRPFWIGTEDYVGSCANTQKARAAYASSRAQGFSPYATDQSASQQSICYWPF